MYGGKDSAAHPGMGVRILRPTQVWGEGFWGPPRYGGRILGSTEVWGKGWDPPKYGGKEFKVWNKLLIMQKIIYKINLNNN